MDETATLKFTFAREGTSPLPLWYEVHVDDQVLFADEVTDTNLRTVEIAVSDAENTHQVRFVLAGKTYNHTRVDENNNIIEDALINVKSITLEDIDITYLAESRACNRHAFNKPSPQESDYVESASLCMGCNGEAKFSFETPAFIWLLENL